MCFGGEKEYTFNYKENGEEKEGVISLTLEEYEDSFSTDLFHLSQTYDNKTVNNSVEQDKLDLIKCRIEEEYGNVKVTKKELKSIMKEIDKDYENNED